MSGAGREQPRCRRHANRRSTGGAESRWYGSGRRSWHRRAELPLAVQRHAASKIAASLEDLAAGAQPGLPWRGPAVDRLGRATEGRLARTGTARGATSWSARGRRPDGPPRSPPAPPSGARPVLQRTGASQFLRSERTDCRARREAAVERFALARSTSVSGCATARRAARRRAGAGRRRAAAVIAAVMGRRVRRRLPRVASDSKALCACRAGSASRPTRAQQGGPAILPERPAGARSPARNAARLGYRGVLYPAYRPAASSTSTRNWSTSMPSAEARGAFPRRSPGHGDARDLAHAGRRWGVVRHHRSGPGRTAHTRRRALMWWKAFFRRPGDHAGGEGGCRSRRRATGHHEPSRLVRHGIEGALAATAWSGRRGCAAPGRKAPPCHGAGRPLGYAIARLRCVRAGASARGWCYWSTCAAHGDHLSASRLRWSESNASRSRCWCRSR